MAALIMVVEDEAELASIFAAFLEREGFRTVRAADGIVALQLHRQLAPDLVVLDVKLPGLDGASVLAEMRRRGDTPVIMATAMGEDLDKLTALKIGADDYLTKPFNPLELVARVHAVLRRVKARASGSGVLRLGRLEIDTMSYEVRLVSDAGGLVVPTTLTEFRLLAHMAGTPRKVFSRAELADACLPQDSNALDRTIDSHIRNLRGKFAVAGGTAMIEAVRGVGFRLCSA